MSRRLSSLSLNLRKKLEFIDTLIELEEIDLEIYEVEIFEDDIVVDEVDWIDIYVENDLFPTY